MSVFQVIPLAGMPLVTNKTPLGKAIADAAAQAGEGIGDGDIVAVTQKIVSKAEGRAVRLSDVTPGAKARQIADETDRDPALVELILSESREIMRATPAAIITRHKTGHVLANAGIDASNISGNTDGADTHVLLWPDDPDASARRLRDELSAQGCGRPAIIIVDSMGRAWRQGTLGTAIGCAGIAPLDDQRGDTDLFGRTLHATIIAVADSLAAVAALAMGEGAEGTPVALIRGGGHYCMHDDGPGMTTGLRPFEQDMFR